MNFGYHSNWTGSDVERSRTTIYAKDLLKRLANFRKGCPERPILFVAHRLGGLIVKEVSDCKFTLSGLANRR